MKTDFGTREYAEFCRTHRPAYHANYYAMYSSWWDAITTDPNLMVVPVDDHMVHRGDGLFETFKCVDGAVYNLDAHLDRLEHGAQAIALRLRWTRADIRRIVGAVLKAGGRRDALVRVFASRGRGGIRRIHMNARSHCCWCWRSGWRSRSWSSIRAAPRWA